MEKAVKPTCDNLVVFVRIPKTAGSTMKRILWQNYQPQSLLQYISDRPWQPLFDQIHHDQKIQCVQGHFGFGIDQNFQRPCTYFTMLRDPIERTLSYYYHVHKHLSYYASLTANKLPTPPLSWDFFCRNLANNVMTRYLSGCEWQYLSQYNSMVEFELDKLTDAAVIESYINIDGQKMLAAAKQNIDKHFSLVALTERFDQSLLLMKNILGWHNQQYVNYNVSSNRLSQQQHSSQEIDCIKHYNQLDLELYNYGQTIFERQIKNIKNYQLQLSYLKSNKWYFQTKQKIKNIFT